MKSILIISLLSFVIFPGMAAENQGTLENKAVALNWRVEGGKLHLMSVHDKLNDKTLPLAGECFQVVLGDGTVLKSSDFTMSEGPRMEPLQSDPKSPNLPRHEGGKKFVSKFSAPRHNLSAEWQIILRDNSTYLRPTLTLHAVGNDVLVKEIILLEETIPGAELKGTVDGSPVVAGNFFIGYEHPMAQNTAGSNGLVRCSYVRNAVLKAGESLTQGCVIGITAAGQLRRGFLQYVERERAHPYRPFLHYNSWYDIAWANRKFNETESLNAIESFGNELVKKRGVRMDSFLFDDGWDDNQSLWNFHSGFPNGFTPLRTAAEGINAGVGVWLSPFGGYADARAQRLKFGSKFGFETNASGFSLAGPKYYQRFHDICLEMVQKYGVNQFKFDGLAAGGKAGQSGLTRDGDAMLNLIADLRAARPDIYINQTTGTWPSPFWLLFVDSTWRGGSDHSFAGKGSWCQRWMTYRDAQTYQNVVQRGPFYPLNSLMLHGIIYATNAQHLSAISDSDFRDQVRAFFGNGTQLQEMYVTPSLLNQRNWDDLAEAAKWSRANADVLVDTHWIGGDPRKNEVYGWASWSPHKAILVLRNPDDQPAAFLVDAAKVFDLPSKAKQTFSLQSPWHEDRKLAGIKLRAGEPAAVKLQPFEVLVLESN